MDIWFNIALVAHLLALLVAGTAVAAMPLVAGRIGAATPDGRALLGGLLEAMGRNIGIALGVLLVSGPLMLWLRYGGLAGLNAWFWVKMALIVVMVAASQISALYRRRAGAGVPAAYQRANVWAWVARLSLLGVVIAAVFAFN